MKDLTCRCLFLRVRPYNDLSKILDDFPSLVFAIFLLRDFEREIEDFFIVHFDRFVVSSGAVHRQLRVKVSTFPCYTIIA